MRNKFQRIRKALGRPKLNVDPTHVMTCPRICIVSEHNAALHQWDKQVDKQSFDFILSSVVDKQDYLSAEDKSDRKGVKKDARRITQPLEAITCQWSGTIRGSRTCENSVISYIKVPPKHGHCSEAALFLMAALSLKVTLTIDTVQALMSTI